MRSKKPKFSQPAPSKTKVIKHTFDLFGGNGGIVNWEDMMEARQFIQTMHPHFQDSDITLECSDYETPWLQVEEEVPNENYQQEYEEWKEAKDEYEGKITEKDKLKRKIDRLQKKLVAMGE